MTSFRYFRLMSFVPALLLWAPPALAEPHGGIEIGAKGVRAIAVDVGPGDSKILWVETKNTTLVADLGTKKEFTATNLDETAEAVAKFAKRLREEFKVSDGHLHVVGSSGIFAPLDGDEKLIKANKDRLAEAVRKSAALPLDFVSVSREAELTIMSVVPPRLRDESVLLDIGSGNTKGGAVRKGGALTFGIPFGTISFFDRVKQDANKEDVRTAASRLRKEVLMPKLQEALKDKDELTQRKRVYLAGGTVWALTTFVKPEDRGDTVELTPGDFMAFAKLLNDRTGELPDPDLSRVADAEVKKRALEDAAQVRKTFTRDQLIAGTEVLNALVEGFHLDAKDKHLHFARQAYIGWLLGYVIEKAQAPK